MDGSPKCFEGANFMRINSNTADFDKLMYLKLNVFKLGFKQQHSPSFRHLQIIIQPDIGTNNTGNTPIFEQF